MAFLPPFYTVLVGFVPLPMPFINALREVEIETSTDEAGVFRLHFDLSQTAFGDWDVLQFDIFRPLVPVSIRLHLGLGLSEPIINGYVRSVRLENRNEPGQSKLEVQGMDATASLMNLQQRPFPFPNMPDSGIAAFIFAKYGIIPIVFPTPITRIYPHITTVQCVPDIRYLKALARRNAFECYVLPDPLVGLDTGYFGPPQIITPPQGVLSVNFGVATNTNTFDVHNDMLQPTAALALALDHATKMPMPGLAPVALEPPMGLEPSLLRVLPLSRGNPPIVRLTGTDAANTAELMATARGVANRSSRSVRASGEIDGLRYGAALRPGLPVLVRGAGREHSGLYYVTKVKHDLSADRYTQHFEGWRNAVGLTGAEIFISPRAALS